MTPNRDAIAPLRDFIVEVSRIVQSNFDEDTVLRECRPLMKRLISTHEWLPSEFATPSSDSYRQYLLYCDPFERFSVVSFVWGPGQKTPIHNHTVWGLIGVLRGAELCYEYDADAKGSVRYIAQHRLEAGMTEAISPRLGDWHRVQNALSNDSSISVHLYGGNIGALKRQRCDDEGNWGDFVSGYSAAIVPNLWDRSTSFRA